MTRIRIEPEPWEVITGNARKAYPEECCGVMLGFADEKGKVVRRAQPLRNVASAGRGSRYELHNPDLLRAQRDARGLGMSLIGIYHSHPDRGADFSASDLEASCPWLSYLILSVRDGEVGSLGQLGRQLRTDRSPAGRDRTCGRFRCARCLTFSIKRT